MRAQAHTLEAVIGSLVLVTSLVFALQMTTVTPLSASTSSQFIENQQQADARGALASAEEIGWLEKAVLYWNASNGEFHEDSGPPGYSTDEIPSDNEFGQILAETFEGSGVAYNVNFVYKDAGTVKRRGYIDNGAPTDTSVRTTRTVTLTDDDQLVWVTGVRNSTTVSEASGFYLDDSYPDSEVYKVVTVEVVVWRN